MPWHLGDDLRRFKNITTGHAMIMGRKTYLSIGKPLPNRTSIVLSRENDRVNDKRIQFNSKTQLIFTHDRDDALFVADTVSIIGGKKEIFVIGGAEMLSLFLEQVTKIYLTEIYNTGLSPLPNDAVFNHKFERDVWKTVHEDGDGKKNENNDFDTRFTVLKRRERRYRHRYLSSFYTEQEEKNEWLAQQIKTHKPAFEALPDPERFL